MSVASGILGAQAQESAANKAAEATTEAARVQKQIYEQTRKDFAPYQYGGYQGLSQLTGQTITYTDPQTGETRTIQGTGAPYDLMKGVGEQPSWEKEYTQQLGKYTESPAYQAQNAIAQQNLQRQLAARGLNYGATGASAGAELSRQLTATDYDKYRQDLASRYAALQGEYGQRRDINAQQYNQLLDLAKIGQGAAGSTGAAGTQYGQQVGQTQGSLANIYQQSGQQAAQNWGDIGKGNTMAVAAGLSSWFGKGGA